jgi:hypothetical protein
MKLKKAVEKINENGVLLVFPINNSKEPSSLWSAFYPRTQMRWEWDSDGDNRVGLLWALMKELSSSGQVVYSKWYQGRATFFSKELFTALLCLNKEKFEERPQSKAARNILEALESDSPLSTKQLKKMTELQGKDNEKFYNRALKELFNSFRIVAYGEVDDGAFPSLAVGATKHLFEDLVKASQAMDKSEAAATVKQYMPQQSLFTRFYARTRTATHISSKNSP